MCRHTQVCSRKIEATVNKTTQKIASVRNRSNFAFWSHLKNTFTSGSDTQTDMILTREQCNGLKGYAILLIVIHNYVDHIMGMGCNEMAYSQTATTDFTTMVTTQPSIWHFFSFTGWIGVALFLFVSGYGLMRKYGDGSIDKTSFIRRHVVKLWVLLAPVYILYVVVQHYWCGEPHNWQSIIAQLTFTINFISYGDNGFVIEPGVYWFFGAILQFYLIFLFIRKWGKVKLLMLMAGAIALNYTFLYLTTDETTWWFRQNCIGWGAPFLLGVISAKTSFQPSKSWLWALLPTALMTLYLCMTVKVFIPFTELCTILFFGSLVMLMNFKLINAVGMISASIFVIHPFIRMTLYQALGNTTLSVSAMVAIYLALVMVFSLLHHLFYRKTSSTKPHTGLPE